MSADSPTLPSPRTQILDQMAAAAAGESAAGLSRADLEDLADSLWTFSEPATGKAHAVGVRDLQVQDGGGLDRSVLEVAGPDMPFLVDSLLNECAAQGHEVLTLFHPIVRLDDGRARSAIQIHLPRLTQAEAQRLADGARQTLGDVRLAVGDFDAMRAAMLEEIERLATVRHLPIDTLREAIAFLRWLSEGHFVFLGKRTYRLHRDAAGQVLPEEPDMVAGANLGLLRDPDANVLHRSSEPSVITPEVGRFLDRPTPLIIARSTMESRVHRRAPGDYIGIKHYDEAGRVAGETRFLGLFTAEAYNEPVSSIPLIRERARDIIEAAGAARGSYSEKALSNLLETWPRDELLQSPSETLIPMLHGALSLLSRPRTRLFLRYDEFGRFVTAIVYVPRESYDTDLRHKIARQLEGAFRGRVIRFQPQFGETPLARVLFNIRLATDSAHLGAEEIEPDIVALARSWRDAFRQALMRSGLEGEDRTGALCFRDAFNAAYREAFLPEEALADVAEMARLSAEAPIRLRAYRLRGDAGHVLRAKVYARSGAIALSDCVPILENMGLFVEFETGYPVRPEQLPVPDAPDTYWVHALSTRTPDGAAVDLERVGPLFQKAFVAVWSGLAENDGFNRLVLSAGLSWRDVALLRALAAYRRQSGRDPMRATQIAALSRYPALACQLVELFRIRFDPALDMILDERAQRCTALRAEIEGGLNAVSGLEDDRVIRRIADLIPAIRRTNHYQGAPGGRAPGHVAFKIASREIEDLPRPRPDREIFTASPKVEGVHLRFGPVARGGLRWSDRRDDFRTEVLGLVKAQQVKNAVIVPVGSKGGFFPKHLPDGASRDAWIAAGVEAYQEFISALLGLTDNLVDGRVIHPSDTVIWDDEDPYLVVAADKGTATFSDTANEISEAEGFWLGDAFASGGSAGYDHKKMGITARGAWEAVKRHFREMGRDIQTSPFTVIGVGDMSGDVFGNGMLLSKEIRLLAAFNHMHVFVDPDPGDPRRLWEERKRLFDTARSTWDDYDRSLISQGGGIFERAAKAITLSSEIKALTGLTADRVAPADLIHALLKGEADLLWFGGIGTYVKAAEEGHADVGDTANDPIRIDAGDLRVRVIGEGANLGMTQAARVAFASAGGRINTDAIDNSAGVDSSDHEVNIKILASEAIQRGDLARAERNSLLAEMTGDVAAHVLAHNVSQTAALTLCQASALADHGALERTLAYLEERGGLDRMVEGLPSTADMRLREEEGAPLNRPELAPVLAWSKIVLFDDLVASKVPDDPHFADVLRGYFPGAIRRFDAAIDAHPLRREIIATVLANRLLDAIGPAALQRLRESTRADNAEITRGFEIAWSVLNGEAYLHEGAALDNTVPARIQTQMHAALANALIRATEWLTGEAPGRPIGREIARIEPALATFRRTLRETASPFVAARIERRARSLMDEGVPDGLARWSAAIASFADGIAIVALVDGGNEMPAVAEAYFRIGDALRLDRLRASAEESLTGAGYWDRVAIRRLIDDINAQQVACTRAALTGPGVEAWLEARAGRRHALLQTLPELTAPGEGALARLSLASDAVRRVIAGG